MNENKKKSVTFRSHIQLLDIVCDKFRYLLFLSVLRKESVTSDFNDFTRVIKVTSTEYNDWNPSFLG